jgi:hypothetical protein
VSCINTFHPNPEGIQENPPYIINGIPLPPPLENVLFPLSCESAPYYPFSFFFLFFFSSPLAGTKKRATFAPAFQETVSLDVMTYLKEIKSVSGGFCARLAETFEKNASSLRFPPEQTSEKKVLKKFGG